MYKYFLTLSFIVILSIANKAIAVSVEPFNQQTFRGNPYEVIFSPLTDCLAAQSNGLFLGQEKKTADDKVFYIINYYLFNNRLYHAVLNVVNAEPKYYRHVSCYYNREAENLRIE